MFDKDKEKTVWRQYPDYPFIEANQFGEVRTRDRIVTCKNGSKLHVKGRVLKQLLDKDGYLYVHLKVNQKDVVLKVHRIVATCFIPNPDNLPQVNHIYCDRTNNVVSNLEWCSHEYNTWYREKYGKALNRPVIAVNLETLEVLRFESQREAKRHLNIDNRRISDVVGGGD